MCLEIRLMASATCTASSRVGASTRIWVPSAQDQVLSSGKENAAVLPLTGLGHAQRVATAQQMRNALCTDWRMVFVTQDR